MRNTESDGDESSDINPGETITFTFDQDVRFISIELESVAAADSFDVLVDGALVLETTGDDVFLDDLGDLADLTIPANTEITFAVNGVLENATMGPTTSVRLETFTVEIVNSAPLLGDVNLDSVVNFGDISPFIAVLSASAFQAEADINGSGMVDFSDISPFITVLSSQ